jgi:hypothetical protein
MKNIYTLLLLTGLTLSMAGCELVGDIFKAGMWAGVIAILFVVFVVFMLARAIGGRRPLHSSSAASVRHEKSRLNKISSRRATERRASTSRY